jgi:hypothetical protein
MICTVTDYNYLYKFLCLYESLDYPISVLCIDDETYEKLKSLSLDNLTVYSVYETGLIRDKNILYCNELQGTTYSTYCFALASMFSKYIMDNTNPNWVTYIDSDEYFYKSFDLVLNNIGDKSIGFTPHIVYDETTDIGKFNVGVGYFKNDNIGRGALNLWVDCVINSENPYRLEYGSYACPDQKYIDLLWKKYQSYFKIIEVKHGAPYLFDYYDNQEDYVFIHFMKFKVLGNGYSWVDGVPAGTIFWSDGKFIDIYGVRELYDDYYEKSLKVIERYNL